MAENILYDSSESEEEQLYSSSDNSDVDTEISEELNVKLEELTLEMSGRKGATCESCVREECPGSESSDDESMESFNRWCRENYERARELYGKVAVFFCFLCRMFVCAECLPKHQWHEGKKVKREEGKGMEDQRERERNKESGLGKETKRMRLKPESERKEKEGNESDRMREKGERERQRRFYIENLFQDENETERTEKLFSSHAVICDRIDVKHELDQTDDCYITGLCGLENKRLVVCDWLNDCIKIFKLGSHVLQRYIRFVGSDSVGSGRSKPWDVTEIDLKQNSTQPNLVSGSSSDISAADRADPDKQCLIAVTLPGKRQIMFIDLSKKPAKAQKTIKTEKECRPIQFYDDKIFTVCREDPDSRCSVYIYSTDGDTLNKFDTGIYGYPHLAVVSGRVYITDEVNNKVQCRNVEGQLISEIKIKRSRPVGISVDPDNNVYVCAWRHNKIYKLDADLTRYKSVLDQTTDYIEKPVALCYYRDKLFISHIGWRPSLYNFVTVVRLL